MGCTIWCIILAGACHLPHVFHAFFHFFFLIFMPSNHLHLSVALLDKLIYTLDFLGFKINTWGYSTINFFAPMSRYASSGGGPLKASQELKEMVKALHGAGIEVTVFLPSQISISHQNLFLYCFCC